MILRNGTHPGGIDLGPARNSFRVGTGTSMMGRRRSQIAAQLYAKRTSVKTDASLLALAAAAVRRAIKDARAGDLPSGELGDMIETYRLACGLGPSEPIPLSAVRDWLREDAETFLRDLGIPADRLDPVEVDDAFTGLINHLQREPEAA